MDRPSFDVLPGKEPDRPQLPPVSLSRVSRAEFSLEPYLAKVMSNNRTLFEDTLLSYSSLLQQRLSCEPYCKALQQHSGVVDLAVQDSDLKSLFEDYFQPQP